MKDLELKLSKAIQHQGQIGGWELDVVSGKTSWTEELYRIHAVPVGEETALQNGILFYKEEDRPRISKAVSDCIQFGKSFDDEFQICDRDGVLKWVRSTGRPIRNENSEIVKLEGTFQDITEFKKRELELQKLNLELDAFASGLNACAIVIRTTPDGIVLSANRRFSEVSGYEESEIIGKKLSLLDSQHHSREFFSDLWESIKSGKQWRGEICNRARNGSLFWVDSTITPIRDQDGKIFEFLSLQIEVTARKKSEEELEVALEFERMISKILDISDSPLNLDQKLDSVLESICSIEFLNLSQTAALFLKKIEASELECVAFRACDENKSFLSNPFQKTTKMTDQCFCGERIQRDMFVHPGGDEAVMHLSIPLLDVDQNFGALILFPRTNLKLSFNDIQNWKSLSRSLSEMIRKARYKDDLEIKSKEHRFILENMKVGVWSWDIPNNQLEWDDSNYRIYGLEKANFSGAFEAWESVLHPDSKEKALQDVNDALEGRRDFLTTFAIKRPDGSLRYIGGQARVIRSPAGEPLRMEGINWDRTEEYQTRLALEEEKKISAHHAKLASIGRLASGVGHEINNPLAIMLGYLDSIKTRLKKPNFDLEDIFRRLDKISIAGERIKNIVQGLRSFSRSDDQGLQSFALIPIIRETVSLLEEMFQSEGIKMKINTELDESFSVRVNRGQIQQVLVNLISNAKDATEGLDERHIEISVSCEKEDEQVVIDVRDNGPGVPAEIQDRIFDPFFTSKPVNKGTGLGLSIAHQITEAHGGTLKLLPRARNQTIFRLSLPTENAKVPIVDQSTSDPNENLQSA